MARKKKASAATAANKKKAPPKRKKEPKAIQFLQPTGESCLTSLKEGVFPPTIYSDAFYAKGIRIFPDSCQESKQDGGTISLTFNHDYIAPLTATTRTKLKIPSHLPYYHGTDSVPLLSPPDARLWPHKKAAKMAVAQHFPVNVFRLLGVITREVSVTNDSSLGPFSALSKYSKPVRHEGKVKLAPKQLKMNLKTSTTEAQAEYPADANLTTRAGEIQSRWNMKVGQGSVRKGWDSKGQLPVDVVNDDQYVPLPVLQEWLKKHQVSDPSPSHTSLYNGLRSIPNDLDSIVASLLELSSPEGLFSTALVLPYAVVETIDESRSTKARSTKSNTKKRKTESIQRTYKIRIGVYANRLLPEVMTSHDLHIVMTAIDQGSYRLVEPLHLPPFPKEPVFASAPTPIVVTSDEWDETSAIDSDTEEKKEEEMVDMTIAESTRDESRISAFSVNGFLKLLESTGNDISDWPKIEPILASSLKLQLMLHQQHAICWMLQLESLPGYGINSILWEEREFLDGGRYFYSPALGQIRLAPPPVMKGGILADAMGLGKTLEVLGLIVASRDELMNEAEDASKDCGENDPIPTHATLIIVPPALVCQWKAEIRKAVGDSLIVDIFNQKSLRFERDETEEDDVDPDIVIATYGALSANNSSRVLSSYAWGRIVLDEMQEIRSSTTKIAKNCDSLSCQRRWMLSGTPLFEGIGDLRGELNFLHLEPYAARLEDGFFDFSITNHWQQHSLHGLETLRILGMLMLRRSKSMTIAATGAPLLGLKPLTVEFVPVPQDPSERAIYCFLESIISRVLQGCSSDTKKSVASRRNCLRILKDMCISPILLSGGMGTSSKLSSIHQWMVQENRRNITSRVSKEGTSNAHGHQSFPFACHARTFSCDEAIEYLSTAQTLANVGEGFVTDQQMGLGGGGSNRNRAAENATTMLQEAEETVDKATTMLAEATSKKARALWHWALEKITTGHLDRDMVPAEGSPSISLLWKLRSIFITACDREIVLPELMPAILLRGWRSSETVQSVVFHRHPSFAWAHPHTCQLDAIPSTVTTQEVGSSISQLLQDENGDMIDDSDERVCVVKVISNGEKWVAVVQFSSEDDLGTFQRKAGSVNGVALASQIMSPQLQEAIDTTRECLDEAEAEDKVIPSASSRRKLAAAKKRHDRALLGLRIVLRTDGFPGHVLASKAFERRLTTSKTRLFTDLYQTMKDIVQESNSTIRQSFHALQDANQKVAKFSRTLCRQVSADIEKLSVFDILSALAEGENDRTQCPICLCKIGVAADMNDVEKPALVAMTHCNHVFCADCLKDFAERGHRQVQLKCPTCRRLIDQSQVVLIIDTEKTEDHEKREERRQEAKAFIKNVARMLDESNGQLEPSVWHELYLSIDLPSNASTARHPTHNAIPGEVLAHLRAATNVNLSTSPRALPSAVGGGTGTGLSSKIRALLADLPQNERSVVFTETKGAVLHLKFVLERAGIGHRALFSGENVAEQAEALQDWKSTLPNPTGSGDVIIPFPVLIVQSGAASCGLTLTAACKMFIMEPFERMEQEQQAYARCHRFGQEHAVHVKCYFAPVSVEARLLDWRKRVSERPSGNSSDTRIVYSPVVAAEDDDGEDSDDDQMMIAETDEDEADQNRTRFLLGLCNNGE